MKPVSNKVTRASVAETAARLMRRLKRRQRLELLLTCPVCEARKVIQSLAYEPRFEPSVASVHPVHPREGAAVDAIDRAA